jgi:hypothetical protein
LPQRRIGSIGRLHERRPIGRQRRGRFGRRGVARRPGGGGPVTV